MGIAVAHIALWTNRLEELRDFYVRYFDGESGPVYRNPAKGFESFFVRFDGVVALELMRRTDIRDSDEGEHTGFCHVAFGVGSREAVCSLTERLRRDGYRIAGEPRQTGDGYFEKRRLRPRRQPDRDRSLTGYLEIWTARNCVSFIWVPPILRWPRCGDWWKRAITSSAS